MTGENQAGTLNREVMGRYFASEHTDVSGMADDVVFTVMARGDEYRGPQAVLGMLEYFYRGAFEATAEPRATLVDGDHATWEGSALRRPCARARPTVKSTLGPGTATTRAATGRKATRDSRGTTGPR